MSVTGRSLDRGTKTGTPWEALDHPVPLKQTHISPEVFEEHKELQGTYTKSKDVDIGDNECAGDNQGDVDASPVYSQFGVSDKLEHDTSIKVHTPRTPSDHTSNSNESAQDNRQTQEATSQLSRRSIKSAKDTQNSSRHRNDTATYVSTQPNNDDNIDAVIEEFEAFARKSTARHSAPNDDIDEEDDVTDEEELPEGTIAEAKGNRDHNSAAFKNPVSDMEGKHESDADDVRRSFTRDTTFTQDNSMFEAREKGHRPSSEFKPRHNSGPGGNTYSQDDSLNDRTNHVNRPPSYNDKRFSTPKDPRLQNGHPNGHAGIQNGPSASRPRTCFNKNLRTTHAFTETKLNREKRSKGSFRRTNSDNAENEEFRKVPPMSGGAIHYSLPPGYHNGQYGYPAPAYHPPPAFYENGITRESLLDVLSKGLGDFTNDMAGLLLHKLREENESLANQVGTKVKDEAISELKRLRDQVASLEKEKKSLTAERDKLKTDMTREKEQMKREYEKERLKRVKEFEEKVELIAKLQEDNERLQNDVKDREKRCRKVTLKVKNHEEKLSKIEDEHKQEIKKLQKQIDKFKGDMLVHKSKKRLQETSSKDREKTRLISNHGGNTNKPYTVPKHEPYVEGDP